MSQDMGVPEDMLYDPEYQKTLFLIEDALQNTGVLERPRSTFTDVYDNQLRTLIESVPLE